MALRTMIIAVTMFSALLLFAYIGLTFIPPTQIEIGPQAAEARLAIERMVPTAWEFIRPLLQLIVVLTIVLEAARRLLPEVTTRALGEHLDIRSLLAVIVVAAFAIGALAGVPGMSMLENVALVIVGFYFGNLAQRRSSNEGSTPSSMAPPANP